MYGGLGFVPLDLDLGKLTHAEKDTLILPLFTRIEKLEQRVADLTRLPKTLDNFSASAAQGHKPNHSPQDNLLPKWERLPAQSMTAFSITWESETSGDKSVS